jgi:hypothetical protein
MRLTDLDSTFVRTSVHHDHDSPLGIGSVPPNMRPTAPILWGEIVFMMNAFRN